MRIVITGANGFIGRNLRVRLRELGHTDVVGITSASGAAELTVALADADFVFHLAGVNRPKDASEFATGNAGFTRTLCDAIAASGRPVPVAYSSSTQAALDNPYGRSKKQAEDTLLHYAKTTGAHVHLFRLTNVFGKWCRPNYNSAVATFCHNVARGLPITVNDPAASLQLIHVDDVVQALIRQLVPARGGCGFVETGPVYTTTVGETARAIQGFAQSRQSLAIPNLSTRLERALYATYLSSLPPESFAYTLPRQAHPQGELVAMLRAPDCGEFSYLVLNAGVTRGEHLPCSKAGKFLVVRGTARFCFRHIETGQLHELVALGGEPRVVEAVPGWSLNITNIGDDEVVAMLWSNETFDNELHGTVAQEANP